MSEQPNTDQTGKKDPYVCQWVGCLENRPLMQYFCARHRQSGISSPEELSEVLIKLLPDITDVTHIKLMQLIESYSEQLKQEARQRLNVILNRMYLTQATIDRAWVEKVVKGELTKLEKENPNGKT